MSSTSETGHAKNVANFDEIISKLEQLGAVYVPSNAAIGISQLKQTATNARTTLDSVNDLLASYAVTVDRRRALFKEVRKKSQRIIAILKASGVSEENIENAAIHYRKMVETKTRETKTPPTTEGEAGTEQAVRSISTSQKSFTQLAEHYDKLISVVALITEYNPNEAAYKMAALQTDKDNLLNANKTILDTLNNLSAARYQRNELLYKDQTGICDLVRGIKNYLKVILDSSDQRYKSILKVRVIPH